MQMTVVAPETSCAVSAQQAFVAMRGELKGEFGDDYGGWIAPLKLLGEADGAVVLAAPLRLQADWVRLHAQHRLEAQFRRLLGRRVSVAVHAEQDVPERLRRLLAAPPGEAGAAAPPQAFDRPAEVVAYSPTSFAAFAVGATNRAAYLVARDVAAGAAGAFPIVLLHGPPGVGKTHLMQAVHHEALIATPGRRTRYMMAQIFIEEFQAGLAKRKDLASFKASVRETDLFLLDDVHRIAGKRATEEEFLDTIQVIVSLGGQVVVSADQGPQGLLGFDERLRSQLKGATECAIAPPDVELRRRILDLRVELYQRTAPEFAPPPEVLDMVAKRLEVTGRELDGAVRQLLVAHRGEMPITLETAGEILKAKLCEPERRPTVDLILKTTARHFNLEHRELLQKTRQQGIARPRQIAMYLACTMTTRSLPDIGRRFGGFDHTTVLYAKRRVPELMEKDASLRDEVEKLTRAIREQL